MYTEAIRALIYTKVTEMKLDFWNVLLVVMTSFGGVFMWKSFLFFPCFRNGRAKTTHTHTHQAQRNWQKINQFRGKKETNMYWIYTCIGGWHQPIFYWQRFKKLLLITHIFGWHIFGYSHVGMWIKMNDFVISEWYALGAQTAIDEQQHIIMVFHNENRNLFKSATLRIHYSPEDGFSDVLDDFSVDIIWFSLLRIFSLH